MVSHRFDVQKRLSLYRPISLKADLSKISLNERQIIPYLRNAASQMDLPYWTQEYGDPSDLLNSIDDPDTRRYCEINYGPWDRMFGNEALLEGVGSKPRGANYYPPDITAEEFDKASRSNPELKSPFSMVRRAIDQKLVSIPYHEFFHEYIENSVEWLQRAAAHVESTQLKNFLKVRSDGLLMDKYGPSDVAWLEVSNSNLDILIGPTEIEDQLFGIKAAYSGTIFRWNRKSSNLIARLHSHSVALQSSLPLSAPQAYPIPEINSEIRVYDMLYAAGLDRCYLPAGVAWPADETIQIEKGIRSIVVENILRAKFVELIQPLSSLLILPEQRKYVHSDARFLFVALHEMAHGMGVRYVDSDQAQVGKGLRELSHAFEEAKANLIALWLAIQLAQKGELAEEQLMPLFVTFLVSLLYNVDAPHSVLLINHFRAAGAFRRGHPDGCYSVLPDMMPKAVKSLLHQVLQIQADADFDTASSLIKELGEPDGELVTDIERINKSELPIGLYIDSQSA